MELFAVFKIFSGGVQIYLNFSFIYTLFRYELKFCAFEFILLTILDLQTMQELNYICCKFA